MIELTALQQNIIKSFKDIGNMSNSELAIIMAQIEAETNFVNFEERFNYSLVELIKMFGYNEAVKIEKDPVLIANHMYNGRMGNEVGTDDGYTFRGRGLFMITGRDNYMLCLDQFEIFKKKEQNVDDFITSFVIDQNGGLYMSAYWAWNCLFKRPKTIDDATYAINGRHASLETLDHRRKLYKKWLGILNN